jgi:hypothetical protein
MQGLAAQLERLAVHFALHCQDKARRRIDAKVLDRGGYALGQAGLW